MDEMTSCDRARRTWFGPATGTAPDAGEVADALAIRAEVGGDDMPRGEAVHVAHLIECYFGWPMVEGVVLAGDGEPLATHAWNVLPDGGLLDATADLHGGPTHVSLSPGAAGMRNYRREWTASYNPSLSSIFEELEGTSWDGQPDALRMENCAASPAMTMG